MGAQVIVISQTLVGTQHNISKNIQLISSSSISIVFDVPVQLYILFLFIVDSTVKTRHINKMYVNNTINIFDEFI